MGAAPIPIRNRHANAANPTGGAAPSSIVCVISSSLLIVVLLLQEDFRHDYAQTAMKL